MGASLRRLTPLSKACATSRYNSSSVSLIWASSRMILLRWASISSGEIVLTVIAAVPSPVQPSD